MQKTAPESRWRRWWREEVRPLVVLALVLFSLRSSLADWNDVPTGSMKPTILVGDRVWVNKVAYDLKVPFTTLRLAQWADPARGEIVVFYSPHDGKRLVKRVIGLPGDTVELRQNRLLINGESVPCEFPAKGSVDEPESFYTYATEALPGATHTIAGRTGTPARRDFGPITVPDGEYFMMGDNRDESFDSRCFGTVKRDRILGRSSSVVLSFDRTHYWRPRLSRCFSSLGA